MVQDYINKELQAGRIEGPLFTATFSPKIKGQQLEWSLRKVPGELRSVRDPSYPKGASVNDKISSKASSVSYASTEGAIKLVKTSGVGFKHGKNRHQESN